MVFLMALLWLGAPASANGIVVLGDSISAAYGIDKQQGWVALLQDRLDGQCPGIEVNNASVSGETTAGGLSRLPPLLSPPPRLVVIELGGNDGLRGLSPQAMEQNLRRMIESSREAGATVLLLGMLLPANYGEQYVNLFRQTFARVAADTGVAFVPFFLESVAQQAELMQDDGIHPTAAAQPVLLENAWPKLWPLIREHCNA